jgi:adenylylsulfate kinase
MVIWLTGLSGSGKTTIANLIYLKLKKKLTSLVLLDGDVIREIFGNDLGHSEPDRKKQISRIQRLTLFLEGHGIPVIVAALYSNQELLQWNRDHFHAYYEIYVSASLEVVEARDTKGLYSSARSGSRIDVVGIDIAWHEPKNPHFTAKPDEGPGIAVDKIIKHLTQLRLLE